MNTIHIKYNISRVAAAALRRLDDPCRLSLYIELLYDAVATAGYEPAFHGNRPEKEKLVTGTISVSRASHQIVRRLQKAGLTLSDIIEEALYFAFRSRLFS